MKSAIRAFAAWIFTAIYWTLVPLAQLLAFKTIPLAYMAASVRFWARVVLRILGIRLELENEIPFQGSAPRVIVSNHQSALDTIVGAALSPSGVIVVAKKEIFYIPFINLGWWALDFVGIDRGNTASAIRSLSGLSEKIAKQKRTVWILPEGTRSPPGEVRQFKKGAFHIAIKAQCPIYPVSMYGAGELMSKANFLAKPGVVRVRFLPPVETRGMTIENVDTLVAGVQAQISKNYFEMRQNALQPK